MRLSRLSNRQLRRLLAQGEVRFAQKYDVDKISDNIGGVKNWLQQQDRSSKYLYILNGLNQLKANDPRYANIWNMWQKSVKLKSDYEDMLFEIRRQLAQLKNKFDF